jgi:hypothetical protein
MPTPDFSKIWASSSPLPAYTFTDAEYVTGWDFVGSAPPTKNEFDAWFRATDEKLNWLYSQLQDTASKLYPVGSVYISFSATDPSTLFGGTWSRLKDTFLLVNGDNYAPNTTGGSATKTIGVTNLPAHKHTVNASTHSHSVTTAGAGGHTHTASSNTTGSHTHKRGTMNITGTIGGWDVQGGASASGAFTISSRGNYKDAGGTYQSNYARNFHLDASSNWTGETSSAGSHSHTITVNSVANHTHTVSITNSGSHTHTTNNTGSGTPLNIMPPYTTVYAWRRTA